MAVRTYAQLQSDAVAAIGAATTVMDSIRSIEQTNAEVTTRLLAASTAAAAASAAIAAATEV